MEDEILKNNLKNNIFKNIMKLVLFSFRVIALIYIFNLIIMMSGDGKLGLNAFITKHTNSIYSIDDDNTKQLNVNKLIFHMITMIAIYQGTLKLIFNFSGGLRKYYKS